MMYLHIAIEIRELEGKIKKNTVQGFYERNIKKKDGYISMLDDDNKINQFFQFFNKITSFQGALGE